MTDLSRLSRVPNRAGSREKLALQPDGRPAHDGLKNCSADQPITVRSDLVTADEFAELARLSRRQIDRLRKDRPTGFPKEYELGSGLSKFRSCPRFKRTEVDRWLDSRALW